ncbi:MAG TPA: enolase C-terminal domain-like protein, partial [Roseiflexaceae bacterium]|nr:enolase C-terminal domain-like protein [Roseiflexaceae bacterium]
MTTIQQIRVRDARFQLSGGAGADAVHHTPQYAYAVALLGSDGPHEGSGLAFTLGGGTDLVCRAIEALAAPLIGREIEALMAEFGRVFFTLAEHHQYRWLGPHKGVVHLALAAITNACFDLWAKARGVPLWQLLLDLTPAQLVALLDLSYLEDLLTPAAVIALLEREQPGRAARASLLARGYPGYDTSVGWFQYSDEQIRANAGRALAQGFDAIKLKVGSHDMARDIRRAHLVREVVGPAVRIMLDANQQWSLPAAHAACQALAGMEPFWIEEPTHPDDILGHRTLAQAIAPLRLAAGEHLPNRIVFKSYLQADAAYYMQADCVRIGGVSEFLTVSLLARL